MKAYFWLYGIWHRLFCILISLIFISFDNNGMKIKSYLVEDCQYFYVGKTLNTLAAKYHAFLYPSQPSSWIGSKIFRPKNQSVKNIYENCTNCGVYLLEILSKDELYSKFEIALFAAPLKMSIGITITLLQSPIQITNEKRKKGVHCITSNKRSQYEYEWLVCWNYEQWQWRRKHFVSF